MKKLILNRFKKAVSIMLTAILLLSTILFEVFAANPKISIIIPVYNTPENLLRDCLESAKNQTLKDIEIICVDDGSTDGSGKILDEYAKSDPRFVVVHQENKGLSGARNRGMEIAKGEYIKFLDSDDMIDDVTAEKSYNVAKEYDADIVKYSIKTDIGRGNMECFRSFLIYDKFQLIKRDSSVGSLFDNKIRGNSLVTVWASLYKNEFLKANNIKFFEKIKRVAEDDFFNIICVSRLNKIVFMPDQMYGYNYNPSSIVERKDVPKQRLNSLSIGIKELYNFWKSSGLLSESKMKADFLNFILNQELFRCIRDNCTLFVSCIAPELLQDDVVNKLPISEKIKLKSIMWRVNPQKAIDDGIYIISSKLAPNMCLDIRQCSKDDKANLQLWQKNGTDAQKFKLQYHPNGYYTIKAMCSGKFIDVSASGKQHGTNIWQYSANGTDAQKWFIVPDGDGYCFLLPRCNDFCMDVYGAQAKNGANIHCWYIHGDDNQRFKLEKCEDKPSSSKSNTAQKTATKPRPKKPVKIRKKAYKPSETKKDAGKPSSSKPIDSKKSA